MKSVALSEVKDELSNTCVWPRTEDVIIARGTANRQVS